MMLEMSSKGSDLNCQRPPAKSSKEGNPKLQRIQSNRMMLDLRQQVQWQNQVIHDLKTERDRLTKELASRLFFVEAQLLREQKHIESLLNEKDQYIRFQNLQIESLKCVLSQVDWDYCGYHECSHKGRPTSSSTSGRRSKVPVPLSKRYSVALDEYMKDNGIISRALPVVVQMDPECDKKECSSKRSHGRCTRTLSLPELRFNNQQEYFGPDQCYVPYDNYVSDHDISQNVIDELAARRWTSDCDSEHSDSLDSGISSPSIKSRNIHLEEIPLSNPRDNCRGETTNATPKRSSSIGSFLNRKFSSSSTQLEKLKDLHSSSPEFPGSSSGSSGRRHSSFSGTKTKDLVQETQPMQKKNEEPKPREFISSANRTFGTNHRSVTKPRDIKFRKLFKFRRRTEPVEPDVIHCEDYMTV